MTAVATLIKDAAYAAQILGQDQDLSSGDAQLMLRRLNRLLELRSNEKELIFAIDNQSFTMTAGVGTYLTNLFPKGRPVSINSMVVRLNNIDYDVNMIDLLKWNMIGYKLTQSIPNQCYYNPLFPDGELNFYPRPYAPFLCTVNCQYKLTEPLTLTTEIALPPGYEAWIVAELAVDIQPSFKGGNPTENLMRDRQEARATIKRANFQPLEMVTPFSYAGSDISNAFLYKGF